MGEQVKDKWALVTGASAGIGADFVRELAKRGMNVILVARSEGRLHELKEELQGTYGVDAVVIPMDLARQGAAQELYERVKAEGLNIEILINNAGFGLYGTVVEIPLEKMEAMLNLDVMTVASLTKLFVREMVERDSGYILNVASIGAYQPSPEYASYSAAKSFVLNYGEALNYELRNTGVSCTVISPGVTRTGFFEKSGQEENLSVFQRLTMMGSEKVARIGVRAMFNRRPSVVPGWINSLMVFSVRRLPRQWITAAAHRFVALRQV